MVHVVSMLDVIMRLGDTVFQSKDVKGAVCSGVLEFESRARGVSLAEEVSRPPPRVIVLPGAAGVSAGRDQRRK